MADQETLDMPKAVLTQDEWSALPADLQAAYAREGEDYVADEDKLAEIAERSADENAGDDDDVDEDQSGDDLEDRDEGGANDDAVDDRSAESSVEAPTELSVEMSGSDYELLPDDIKVAYERKGEKWVAVPEFRTAIEQCEVELQALVEQHNAEIAAKEAKIARLDGQIRHSAITTAARDYLIQAGCKLGLMKAAIALFIGSHVIHTDRQSDGSWSIEVEGKEGLTDLPQALAYFLATDEGNVLLEKPRLVS